jgi:hypothetical protein
LRHGIQPEKHRDKTNSSFENPHSKAKSVVQQEDMEIAITQFYIRYDRNIQAYSQEAALPVTDAAEPHTLPPLRSSSAPIYE